MTNEFGHKTAGVTLEQTEWEGIGYHVFDSQSTGDILYASSGTQLSRLGVGANSTILNLTSCIPPWTATTTVTSLTTTSFTTSALNLGTSSSPVTSATDDKIFMGVYLQSSGSSAHGLRIELEKTSSTAGAPRTITVRSTLSHTSGNAPSGANCIDAQTELATGNTGISGEAHGMESKMRVAEESRVVQGTYAAHKFTNQFKTGNTMPASTFFLRFYDVGTVYTPLMFDFSGLTAGSSNCIEANTAALQTAAYFLRVKMPNAATGYIPILGSLG